MDPPCERLSYNLQYTESLLSEEAMEYTAQIHHEDGTYWGEVLELPGAFASGDSVDDLLDGLKEAVAFHLGDGEYSATELSELKLAITA
jgi:predicted RNase H-like HicB family nuclease